MSNARYLYFSINLYFMYQYLNINLAIGIDIPCTKNNSRYFSF